MSSSLLRRPWLMMLAVAWLFASCTQAEKPRAKYVFYFISDGTGINTVLGAEMMMQELQQPGVWGRKTLCMTSFPVVGVCSTHSADSGITDSAASGTCLATGVKTYNGAIGVDVDTLNVYSLAYRAHEAGFPVGVASSVSVNHATPASFYAHVAHRGQYYDIATQLPSADFDFFGGSDINLERAMRDSLHRASLYAACHDAGYVIARGTYADYEAVRDAGARRVMLFQPLQRTLDVDAQSLPYAIDAQLGETSVVDVLRAELDFLSRRSQQLGDKGFFLMNEIGGKVDMACHANDAATAFREVALVDSCVRLAYDFYLQHPNETLIVLTSDHETGGLTLGCEAGHYRHNLKLLGGQTCSVDAVTRHLQALRHQTHNRVTWEQVQDVLRQDLGFGTVTQLTDDEEATLRDLYRRSFVGQLPNEKNLYSSNEPMASAAVRMLNQKACLGWTTSGHTAGLVPVYACGVGAEAFAAHNDNSTIPLTIARLMGIAMP